jgi:hypothetical protein
LPPIKMSPWNRRKSTTSNHGSIHDIRYAIYEIYVRKFV